MLVTLVLVCVLYGNRLTFVEDMRGSVFVDLSCTFKQGSNIMVVRNGEFYEV